MRRRIATAGALCAALLAAAGAASTWGAARLARARVEALSARVGRRVTVREAWARPGRVVLRGVDIDGVASIDSVQARYPIAPLLLGRVRLHVEARGVRVRAELAAVRELAARLRGRGGGGGGGGSRGGRVRIASARAEDATLEIAGGPAGATLSARGSASWSPGAPLRAALADVKVRLPSGPYAAAARVDLQVAPGGSLPSADLAGGRLHLWRAMDLADVAGRIAPDGDGTLAVALRGGYPGVPGDLWTARGHVKPASEEADLTLRAEGLTLDRLGPLIERLPVVDPERARLAGELRLRARGRKVDLEGDLGVVGLTVYHPRLGAAAAEGLAPTLAVRARLDGEARRLHVDDLAIEQRGVTVRARGSIERLGGEPRLTARLEVPPVRCADVIAAIPEPLAPLLARFQMAGTFRAEIGTTIDWADLSEVDLSGRVGIDGCRVLAWPEEAAPERLLGSFPHTVEVAPGHAFTFTVGPENPEFVPLPEVSPHVTAALMTTEDSRFFDHHGFIPREFRSALARNLREGRFAFGASSIPMQTVKNVLLSRDKTLARKLQELALTWWIEQILPKERILEIYLNVIEFGPGIYGIGPAARHYFGKHPRDIAPREAAFFSSILPSPKRRYALYCRGAPGDKWERYLDRILRRMHERGRLTDAEHEVARALPLVFDRAQALPEAECLKLVETLAALDPAAPPEAPIELKLPYLPGAAEQAAREAAAAAAASHALDLYLVE